ncbi:MAG: TolC family protein [Bacteroidales bacterium]|nr:TolC family protein [Candidatus Physcousia equi]
MKKVICTVILGTSLLASCGLYRKYESQSVVPEDVFGTQKVNQESNLADMGWRQMFADSKLQTLIQKALTNNTEAKTALMRMQQAEISYKAARMAYLPTVAFAPTVQVLKQGAKSGELTYSLGAQASWELDIFGAGITNAKRKAKSAAKYATDYEQAVECRLVSTVAALYYELLALDQQTEIQRQMIVLYEQVYEDVKTLYETGHYTSPAVHQTSAQLEQLKTNLIDLQHLIISVEHSLCEVLDEPYHTIERGILSDVVMPASIGVGVPADLLRLRPDVRVAERNIEMAFYDVQLARCAMFPALTLTAKGGWQRLTEDAGLLDPKIWFIQGIGSLVQPIFQGGRLRANLKIKKIDQQIAVEEFRKIVIKAGHEVTNALVKCQMAVEKKPHIEHTVAELREAVMANQELMNYGNATYLEVLSSLQELLQAQQLQVDNQIAGLQALVELYSALGGK